MKLTLYSIQYVAGPSTKSVKSIRNSVQGNATLSVHLFLSCCLKANANRVQEDLDSEFSSLHAVLDELKEGMVTRIKQERASRTYELQVRALCISTRMWYKLVLMHQDMWDSQRSCNRDLGVEFRWVGSVASLCFPYTAVTVLAIFKMNWQEK